jgi:hypothetical protein
MRGWAPKAGFSPWLLPLVALGFPVGAAAAADDAPKLPRAVVPRMIVDLGVVPVGPEATASFAIQNKGEGTLEILEVETSCSCTVADFDPTVEPGSVGTVRASLVTTELSGPVTKGIVVRTNDPDQETIVLSLKAIVKGSVSLLPQPVIFMRKRAGEAPVGRLLIRKDDKEPDALEVGGVTVSDPRLVATAFELDKARPRGGGLPSAAAGDWVLEIRFRDGQPEGTRHPLDRKAGARPHAGRRPGYRLRVGSQGARRGLAARHGRSSGSGRRARALHRASVQAPGELGGRSAQGCDGPAVDR